MPPKAKAKDKGKAPQTQPTKPENPKPFTKLMSSAISAVKPKVDNTNRTDNTTNNNKANNNNNNLTNRKQ